jgi:hypothetical protein
MQPPTNMIVSMYQGGPVNRLFQRAIREKASAYRDEAPLLGGKTRVIQEVRNRGFVFQGENGTLVVNDRQINSKIRLALSRCTRGGENLVADGAAPDQLPTVDATSDEHRSATSQGEDTTSSSSHRRVAVDGAPLGPELGLDVGVALGEDLGPVLGLELNDDDDDDESYNNLDFDNHMDDEIRELPPPHPEPVLLEPLILIPITHQPLVTELYDGPALFTTPILATDTFTPYMQYPMNDTIITQEDIENDNRLLQVLIQREANRTVHALDPDPDADTSIQRDIPMIAGGWENIFSGQPPKWKCTACSVFNEMALTHCASCTAPRSNDDGNMESTAATITTRGAPQLLLSSGTTAATNTTTSIQSSSSSSSSGFLFAAPSTGGTSATITTHVAAAATAGPATFSFTNQDALPQPAPAVVGGFSFGTMSGKTPLVATNPRAAPPLFQSSNGVGFAAAPSTGGTSATITTHVAAAAAAVAAPPPLFGVSNTSTGGSGGTGGGSDGRICCPKVK